MFKIPIGIRYLLVGKIVANLASEMALPLLSVYMMSLGANIIQVGFIFTITSLVPLIFQIVGGWLSDYIGRLRTIAFGSSVASLGYIIFAIAPSWKWILLAMSFEYISWATVGPSFSAYISDQSEKSERGKIYGLTWSLYHIVSIVGPLLGGILAFNFGFRFMFFIAALIYISATTLRIYMAFASGFEKITGNKITIVDVKMQIKTNLVFIMSGGIIIWIWFTDTVFDLVSNMTTKFNPIYMEQIGNLNVVQIGSARALFGIGSVLASITAGWLIGQFSERRIIAVGFFVQAIAFFWFICSDKFIEFSVAMFLFGCSSGALMPSYDSMISKTVSRNMLGFMYGLFGTALGIFSLPFPWISGYLWERYNPFLPYWILLILSMISIPIAWRKLLIPNDK